MRPVAWLLISLLCVVVSIWAMVAMILSALTNTGRRGWQLAVAFDRLGNVAAGGSGLETFSARCWRRRDTRRYALLVRVIDWIFLRFADERHHCENAWLAEELARQQACLIP